MKIIRWQGVIVLLFLVAFVFVFFIFFFDNLTKKILEKSLSLSLQRPVEIKDFDSNLLSLRFSLEGIQVADNKDPYKNVIEIKKVVFNLSSKELAFKKFFVEDLSIYDIKVNSKREKPAFIEKQERQKQSEEKYTKRKLPDITQKLKLPSVEEILKREKLKTIEVGKKYKQELPKLIEKWDKNFKQLQKQQNDIQNLKEKIKNLEKKAKNIKSIDDIKSIKQEVEDIKNLINEKLAKIQSLKKQLKEDAKKIKQAYIEIDKAYKEDISYLKNKYSFDVEGGINLAGLLFGDTVKNYIQKAISIYKTVSPYLKKGEEKQRELEEKGYRLEGKYVQYVEFNPSPDFVVKEGNLSVLLSGSKLTGKIKNFSDNQKLYKKPFELTVSSKKTQYFDDVRFYSKFDRTTASAKDNFLINIKGLKTKEIILKDFIKFTQNIVNVNAEIKVLNENILKGHIKFIFDKTKPVVLKSDASADIIKKLFEGINRFFILIDLKGTLDKPSFGVKSDLDDILSNKFKKLVKEKVDKFNKELSGKLKVYKESYIKEFEEYKSKLDSYKNYVSKYETEYKSVLKQLKDKFSTKKLQKKIKKNLLKKFGF